MKFKPHSFDPFFNLLNVEFSNQLMPKRFTSIKDNLPHPWCILAAESLQNYLNTQQDYIHNFGLEQSTETAIIGKMFGVLIVQTNENHIGYLSAFSGKLAGSNQHSKFVPPVFDLLTAGSFLNVGMTELGLMIDEINSLLQLNQDQNLERIINLKNERKIFSAALQKKIFEQYYFLNQQGISKSLNEIFAEASYKNPPSGAGECAGPKLLQYAFQNQMKPLAIAEFWWGLSPKSDQWKHGHYYACCEEKCKPILAHMLEGINNE